MFIESCLFCFGCNVYNLFYILLSTGNQKERSCVKFSYSLNLTNMQNINIFIIIQTQHLFISLSLNVGNLCFLLLPRLFSCLDTNCDSERSRLTSLSFLVALPRHRILWHIRSKIQADFQPNSLSLLDLLNFLFCSALSLILI